MRRSTNTDTPLPPEEPTGENPPDGAIIDYALASPASRVVISIYDGAGPPSAQVLKRRRRAAADSASRQTALLGAAVRATVDGCGNASVRLGSARTVATLAPRRSADFRGSARHAAGAARPARRSGPVYRPARRRRTNDAAAAPGCYGSARLHLAASTRATIFPEPPACGVDGPQLCSSRGGESGGEYNSCRGPRIGQRARSVVARHGGWSRCAADPSSHPSGSSTRELECSVTINSAS